MIRSWTLDLADAEVAPCETCGPSYDELTVERYDSGLYHGRASVGCYGGGSVDEVDLGGILAFLDEWRHLDEEAVDELRASVLREAGAVPDEIPERAVDVVALVFAGARLAFDPERPDPPLTISWIDRHRAEVALGRAIPYLFPKEDTSDA